MPSSIFIAWFSSSAIALTLAALSSVRPAWADAPQPSPTPSPVSTIELESADVDPTEPLRAVNVQTFYTNASYGPGNLRVGQVIPRFDQLRIGNSYARISFPRYAWTDGGAYGISDSQFVYLASLPPSQASRAGAGFTLYVPSASSPNLGTGTWGLGPAFGIFHINRAGGIATGFLLQSLFSFAGPSTRPKQSIASIQPFVVKRLGNGWSLRSADAQWAFDFKRGASILPVSLGIGKLFPLQTQVLNVVVADVVTVVHANAPAAPKNTWKLTITLMDKRRVLPP